MGRTLKESLVVLVQSFKNRRLCISFLWHVSTSILCFCTFLDFSLMSNNGDSSAYPSSHGYYIHSCSDYNNISLIVFCGMHEYYLYQWFVFFSICDVYGIP